MFETRHTKKAVISATCGEYFGRLSAGLSNQGQAPLKIAGIGTRLQQLGYEETGLFLSETIYSFNLFTLQEQL
jgi:hypothetical protein